MNIWKRTWVSITRRKLNSLVLLLIIFVLANVLLTTLAVTTSLKTTKEMVLKQFPPTVTVEYNNDNFDSEKTPILTGEQVERVARSAQDFLKSYDYSYIMSLTAEEDIKKSNIFDDEFMDVFNNLDHSLMLEGTQLSTTSLVEKGDARLVSGRGFDRVDIKEGKQKAIITTQFAQANGLEVGSFLSTSRTLYEFNKETMSLGNPYFSENIELEVVGIIEINNIDDFLKKEAIEPSKNENDKTQIQMLADKIYVPNNFMYPLIKDNAQRSLEKYPEDKGLVPGASQHITAYPEFVLKDMNDLDTFVKEAKKVYNEKNYTLVSAASDYEVIAKPLNAMQDLLDLIFKISVFASIVVLTLILYIFMYLRQKEMGIYLALGERRGKIVSQLLMETLVIAIIGATLAIFTSIIFSNMLTDNTVYSLLSPSKELSMSIANIRINSDYGLTPDMISKQVQSGFHAMTFITFYATMTLTIFIAQLATVLYLLRLNPKKILM